MKERYSEIFRRIIRESFSEMIRRFESHENYPFLDTKIDLLNHRDSFELDADPETFFRSKKVVYSWIQGRGVESLAEHCRAGFGNPEQVLPILRTVVDSLQSFRQKHNGRMFFMNSTDGDWINPDGSVRPDFMEGDANYSELFVAKGLISAAAMLHDSRLLTDALDWFDRLTKAVEEFRFVTDQQSFDPANPVAAQPGKILMGPFMIALSGITRAAELTGAELWLNRGSCFIRRVLDVHMKWIDGVPDIFEAVHPDGSPWLDNGKQFSDPGHGLEFVGLAQKFLLVLEQKGRPQDAELLDRCRRELPVLMAELFRRGFQPEAGGIIKSYDLIERKPINRDMPWWNLPETIRAAVENEIFCGTDQHEIIQACAEAFCNKFIIPEAHYFAWQTRDCNGEPARAIPAVPDLDPGYHTNLSLIDVLKLWN